MTTGGCPPRRSSPACRTISSDTSRRSGSPSAAQTIDDVTSTVIRSIGTGWTGERMLDWTGTNSNIRYYGTNAHHDTVWTASSTGTVSATLRYDPFGTLTNWSGASLPEFRLQGSWFDTTTSLQWVITRWYAPPLGRFISEDSLLGIPIDPPSRHLYAYSAGEPIGRLDPNGTFWYKVRRGDTLWALAARYLHNGSLYRKIYRLNRSIIKNPSLIRTGWCLWIPANGKNRCLRSPETDTDPTPAPGPAPNICQKHPEFCPEPKPNVDPVIAGIRAVTTVGMCQGGAGGFLIFGGAGDLCAVETAGPHRAITFTFGGGLDFGGHLNAGVTTLLSTGTDVHDQCCLFFNRGGTAAIGPGVSVNIATDWGHTTNVEFGPVAGAGFSARAGFSYTLVYDDQPTIDSFIRTFPFVNPWGAVDAIWRARDGWLKSLQN